MFGDRRKRERRPVRVGLVVVCVRRRADASLDPLRILSFNFFLTIEQRLYRALAWTSLKGIKRFFDAAQHDVQRNALLLPRFQINAADAVQICVFRRSIATRRV
jgi:hypothetical protein